MVLHRAVQEVIFLHIQTSNLNKRYRISDLSDCKKSHTYYILLNLDKLFNSRENAKNSSTASIIVYSYK